MSVYGYRSKKILEDYMKDLGKDLNTAEVALIEKRFRFNVSIDSTGFRVTLYTKDRKILHEWKERNIGDIEMRLRDISMISLIDITVILLSVNDFVFIKLIAPSHRVEFPIF